MMDSLLVLSNKFALLSHEKKFLKLHGIVNELHANSPLKEWGEYLFSLGKMNCTDEMLKKYYGTLLRFLDLHITNKESTLDENNLVISFQQELGALYATK